MPGNTNPVIFPRPDPENGIAVSVEGNIDATEAVELKEKATMVGEIRAPKLGISEGAVFDGRARMKDDAEPAGIQEGNVRPLIPTRTGA